MWCKLGGGVGRERARCSVGRCEDLALRETAGKVRREKSAFRCEATLAIGGKRICGGAAYGSDLNCVKNTNELRRSSARGVGGSRPIEWKQRKSLRAPAAL